MVKTKKPVKTKKAVKKSKKPVATPEPQPEKPDKPAPEGSDQKHTYEFLLSQITDKAARFVQEYLIDLNKQKAAVRAGYSPRSAAQQVCVLLKNPKVIAAINEGKRLIAERTMINQDEVIKELALIGFADMKDFVTVDSVGAVTVLPLDTLSSGKSRIIKRIKERRIIKSTQGSKDKPSEDVILESTLEFELHDKVSSLKAILDRVKPGADDPQKHEVTHKCITDFPPEPKTIAEWESQTKEAAAKTRKEKEGANDG
ncbi:MAG: terminase small subunit [Smithella sp.]|jgi:phage terminase small subunit